MPKTLENGWTLEDDGSVTAPAREESDRPTTVRQLIEALQACDPDMPVVVDSDDRAFSPKLCIRDWRFDLTGSPKADWEWDKSDLKTIKSAVLE